MSKHEDASTDDESLSDEDFSTFQDLRVRESDGSNSDGSQEPGTAGDSLGCGGYLFEPVASEHSDDESEEEEEQLSIQTHRVGHTNWCSCGHCPEMGTDGRFG